ncbi:MAG: S49 family peptidase, partial [Muribaculaceae bacterium]|nr:S49 family peptidase [Muribaculaceae bacterium]
SGRDISVDSVKVIGGGRVWDGKSALNLGLVDKLGSLWDAISQLTSDLGLQSTDILNYPKLETTMLETLIKESKKNLEISNTGLTMEQVKAYNDLVDRIRNMAPIQARMEAIQIN